MTQTDDMTHVYWRIKNEIDNLVIPCPEHGRECDEGCDTGDEWVDAVETLVGTDEVRDDAERWAARHVRQTGPLEVYDSSERSAPTREEYEMGMREAYTDAAVEAHNRHSRTNYDALCSLLDKDSKLDQVYYDAVRTRVGAVIEESEWLQDDEVA